MQLAKEEYNKVYRAYDRINPRPGDLIIKDHVVGLLNDLGLLKLLEGKK